MPVQSDPAGNTEYVFLDKSYKLAALTDAVTVLMNRQPAVPTPIKSYTTATLPTGLTSGFALAIVTDANATTRLSTPAGGGANNLLVFTINNGTAWTIL